ncbi:hypothetical protein HDV00_012126 [Rhizophlyctis rosea]|nr:hypothetical protein HDV00_012126 [Rhizophlyctis rosea]
MTREEYIDEVLRAAKEELEDDDSIEIYSFGDFCNRQKEYTGDYHPTDCGAECEGSLKPHRLQSQVELEEKARGPYKTRMYHCISTSKEGVYKHFKHHFEGGFRGTFYYASVTNMRKFVEMLLDEASPRFNKIDSGAPKKAGWAYTIVGWRVGWKDLKNLGK